MWNQKWWRQETSRDRTEERWGHFDILIYILNFIKYSCYIYNKTNADKSNWEVSRRGLLANNLSCLLGTSASLAPATCHLPAKSCGCTMQPGPLGKVPPSRSPVLSLSPLPDHLTPESKPCQQDEENTIIQGSQELQVGVLEPARIFPRSLSDPVLPQTGSPWG